MLAITILSLCIMLIVFIPEGAWRKQNPYDVIRQAESRRINKRSKEYDQLFWRKSIGMARRLEQLVRLPQNLVNTEKLQVKLNYAGMQKVLAIDDILAVKFMFFVIAAVYFSILYLLTFSSINLMLGLIASVLAFYIPESVISIKAKKRQEEMSRELPGFLTALAVITDAGLNLIPALEVMVQQDRRKGELIKEMGKVLEEVHIGISQKEALSRLSDRCSADEIHYFISALLQGIEKGNNGLTAVIRQQAEESWQKRKYRAKEIAEKASIKLFLPLLCMVFPAFAIFLIGPMIFSLMNLFKIM